MLFSTRWVVSLAFLVSGASSFAAETTWPVTKHPMLHDEFVVTLSFYYPRSATSAALAPSGGGSGAIVNFEDTLDLDKRNFAPSVGIFGLPARIGE